MTECPRSFVLGQYGVLTEQEVLDFGRALFLLELFASRFGTKVGWLDIEPYVDIPICTADIR